MNSKKTISFVLTAVAAFILINCFNFLTPAAQGGADYLLFGIIVMQLLKHYTTKKINKTYKNVITGLIPLIFFGSLFLIASIGRPKVNFICLLVGLAIGGIIFFDLS
jgi:hypothetical protein